MTGGLGTPLAIAVTCAIPVAPGVQRVGVVKESQLPAQAKPVSATVTMFGAVDSKVNVSGTVVPKLFSATAVNVRVFPTSNDAFGAGVRVTIAGTTSGVTLVALLLLLQAVRKKQPGNARAMQTAEVRKANLPMYAFQREMKAVLESSQFRRRAFFRQLRRRAFSYLETTLKVRCANMRYCQLRRRQTLIGSHSCSTIEDWLTISRADCYI